MSDTPRSRPDPREIAAARFELIAPLLDPALGPAQKKARLRELRGLTKRPIPRSTLYRWVALYRSRGIEGLRPKARKDRGHARALLEPWITRAIALLYEQPERSLTQLERYLRLEIEGYDLSRASLARHLARHPAFPGIKTLRKGKERRLRGRYEAQHPHECWQLDGKGPFRVRLKDGASIRVHVLSILDDHSRAILAAIVANAEDEEAAMRVFQIAAAKYGLPERMQFDRGSAFDSHAFRNGLAQCGVHRNAVRAKHPEAQGKIEAYHRSLQRWFVQELDAQEVVDLEHLQALLEAMLALLYNRHQHRELGTSPEKKLAARLSERRISQSDLERAFFVTTTARSDRKTGEVKLPNGRFRVPLAHAGGKRRLRYDPLRADRAVLVTHDQREIELQVFAKKPLPPPHPAPERRGVGQLQKLLDLWQGKERPNAQPGFGLGEVFAELGARLGRAVPASEHEARAILAFYRQHGPLPKEPFLSACQKSFAALGAGRALETYLQDLARKIKADAPRARPDSPEAP